MKADDPLGNAISVSDELAKRGLKGSLNKRAAAAIGRLLGDAVDFLRAPGGLQEERKEFAAAVIEAMAEEALRPVEPDRREMFRPIVAAHYREVFAKHENRRAVVAQALDVLKQMAHAPDDPHRTDNPISDDWLNFFAAYAEKASSENLRQTFGHVLSGEIRKPGSFSFSTLRIVSELDAGSASLFQRIASRAFSMDATDPTPSAVLKPEDLRGQYLHEMLKLEALGLIQEVGGDFAISTSKAEAGAQIWMRFGRLLLRGEMKKKVHFSLQLVKLTATGAELCSIIPMDHHGGAREVGGLMAKRGLEASIHVITGVNKGDVLYRTPGEAVRA
jgi:hypothetical protein